MNFENTSNIVGEITWDEHIHNWSEDNTIYLHVAEAHFSMEFNTIKSKKGRIKNYRVIIKMTQDITNPYKSEQYVIVSGSPRKGYAAAHDYRNGNFGYHIEKYGGSIGEGKFCYSLAHSQYESTPGADFDNRFSGFIGNLQVTQAIREKVDEVFNTYIDNKNKYSKIALKNYYEQQLAAIA